MRNNFFFDFFSVRYLLNSFRLKMKFCIYSLAYFNRHLFAVILILFVKDIVVAQDSACCIIEYRYNRIECGEPELYKFGNRVEFYCDSQIIMKVTRLKDNKFYSEGHDIKYDSGSSVIYMMTDSTFSYFKNDSIILLFSMNKFYSGDTTKIISYIELGSSVYKYYYSYYIPDEVIWYQGDPVYRYNKLSAKCKNKKKEFLWNCDNNVSTEFIDFHPLYGNIRKGESFINYFEISDLQCDNLYYYFKVSGNCEFIRRYLNNGWLGYEPNKYPNK
jgi:hypothetical protein